MSDTNSSGSGRVLTCGECGNEYPIGGSVHARPVETSPESAEHHARDCTMYEVLKDRGQTEDRDVHRELSTDDDRPGASA